MDYFYCPPEKITAQSLLIDGQEYAHLVHVMRKKTGDIIRVIDGQGTAYEARLGEMKKRMVHAVILQTYHRHNEPSIDVALAVGVLKNPSKFDFLVEKVTELGVKEILPLHTQRSIPNHAKVDRWQKLALAAMKQCGRSYLPVVHKLTTLNEMLIQSNRFDLKLIAHENASGAMNFTEITPGGHHSILIMIGPEGGFSEEEVLSSLHSGFRQLFLGERRLRTETAAIVAAGFALLKIT